MSIEGGKLMKEHGGGSIINVASINGVSPGEFQGIYSVTKAAVIQHDQGLRQRNARSSASAATPSCQG